MSLRLTVLLALCSALPVVARAQAVGLEGKMEGDVYVSPTGAFKLPAPVLPELGGKIEDTANVVTFSDDFNIHLSIACFALDASQKWELETRGLRDYLLYFFNEIVLPDFARRFPGSAIESARFVPELMDGSLIAYALLPGGSFFEEKNHVLDSAPANAVTAKRGTLLFVRNSHIFILSTELAERATQRSTYKQTIEQENAVLSARLTELANRLVFPAPKPRS